VIALEENRKCVCPRLPVGRHGRRAGPPAVGQGTGRCGKIRQFLKKQPTCASSMGNDLVPSIAVPRK